MEDKERDIFLFNNVKKDDGKAFATLYHKYYELLVGYLKAERRLHELDAGDIVQEVFTRFWENRKTIQIKISFKNYLFTSVIHQANRNYSISKQKYNFIEISEIIDNPNLTILKNQKESSTLIKKINEAINRLPRKMRITFKLSRIYGLSIEEIAGKTKKARRTVENQITEANKRIIKFLSKNS